MRRQRAALETSEQLSFLGEPTTRPRRRRADQRPLSPAESVQYCNALIAEIDRVARLEKEQQKAREDERVRRLAALYEAAVAHDPDASLDVRQHQEAQFSPNEAVRAELHRARA